MGTSGFSAICVILINKEQLVSDTEVTGTLEESESVS